MSIVPWIEFVVGHAEGHFENLEWNVIKALHIQKRNAVAAITSGINSIEYFERVADIFTNYRKGVLDIEYFIDSRSKTFIDKLKRSLSNAKKQMQGKSKAEKNQIGQEYSDQFLSEMNEFDHMVADEYNRIIPIIFPMNINS